jgi:hypothetical protein
MYECLQVLENAKTYLALSLSLCVCLVLLSFCLLYLFYCYPACSNGRAERVLCYATDQDAIKLPLD